MHEDGRQEVERGAHGEEPEQGGAKRPADGRGRVLGLLAGAAREGDNAGSVGEDSDGHGEGYGYGIEPQLLWRHEEREDELIDALIEVVGKACGLGSPAEAYQAGNGGRIPCPRGPKPRPHQRGAENQRQHITGNLRIDHSTERASVGEIEAKQSSEVDNRRQHANEVEAVKVLAPLKEVAGIDAEDPSR